MKMGDLEALKLYFPVPKQEREVFLDRVRTAVKRYKPLIEEKTKKDLGDIKVKDFHYVAQDLFKENYKELSSELDKTGAKISEKFIKKALFYSLGRPIAGLVRFFVQDNMGLMKHHNSTIYVSFGFPTRSTLFSDRLHGIETSLDQSTVHELSHRLWKKIEGKRKASRNWKLWNEGFATYCEQNWFSDLYPQGYRVRNRGSGVYKKGRQKIEELVQKYDENILLRVPSEWKTFDTELTSKQ